MLGTKFSRLIERHSDEISSRIVSELRTSPRTWSFRDIPEDELARDVQVLLSNIGEWLSQRTERQLVDRYSAIGRRRYAQGIPLEQLIWAFVIAKEQVFNFVRREGAADGALELFSELEFMLTFTHFFDQASYAAVCAYKDAALEQPKGVAA